MHFVIRKSTNKRENQFSDLVLWKENEVKTLVHRHKKIRNACIYLDIGLIFSNLQYVYIAFIKMKKSRIVFSNKIILLYKFK